MNELPPQPASEPADQQEFLRVFLANEREIQRYVAALVPARADAQEIVQQTAILLWEKFDKYDRSRPFAPWACRFALNVTRRWMARRQRWKALLQDGLAEELVSRRKQLQPEFDTRLKHLSHCLQKLPDDQRTIVDGYYFQQLDINTVAQQAERTVEAIYKVLHRIRRKLRGCIERSLREEAAR